MKLWSIHPKEFPLDVPNRRLDHKQGRYWNSNDARLRQNYQRNLLELYRLLQTDQLLWCYSSEEMIRHFAGVNAIKWEVEAPDDRLVFYRGQEWEDILHKADHPWDQLIIQVSPDVAVKHDIEVLVKGPFDPTWFKCLGEPPLNRKIPKTRPRYPG